MKKFVCHLLLACVLLTTKTAFSQNADVVLVKNKDGAQLGYTPASRVKILNINGLSFKDLNKNGALAVADGRKAVRYTRRHAAELGIEPDRIGMIGFSAGGTLIASVAQTYDRESRPNFIAPIYAYTGAILGAAVPHHVSRTGR